MVDKFKNTAVARRGRKPAAVEIDVSPVYDFLLSIPLVLRVEPEADEILEQARWVEEARATMDPSLAEGLHLFFNASLWGGRLFALVRSMPGPKGVEDFLAMLARTRPDDLLGATLYADYSFWPREDSELVGRTLSGDEEARRDLLSGYADDEDRAAAEALLGLGAEEAQRRLLRVLGRWQEEVFAGQEEKLRPALERDAEIKRRMAGRMDSLELVEAATGGVRWAPSARMPRVVLAPSVYARPANYSFGFEGVEVFLYAVADESLGPARSPEPKPATVRLYKALSDPTRLKMLRLLSEREMYPQQVADEMGLSKPTVHHHLVLLRSAGLLSLRREGNLKYHAVRPDALDDPSSLLKEYLGFAAHPRANTRGVEG